MPLIGWLFILVAFAMVIGSLLLLRETANMKIPKEKMNKIRQRQKEAEQEDRDQDRW